MTSLLSVQRVFVGRLSRRRRSEPSNARAASARQTPYEIFVSFLLLAAAASAQPQFPVARCGAWANENDLGGSLVRTEGSGVIDEDLVKTAREVVSHSTGTPNWSNPRAFEKDVFTFARAIFKVGPNTDPGYGFG